jgi:AraC-like DNA-binding protein
VTPTGLADAVRAAAVTVLTDRGLDPSVLPETASVGATQESRARGLRLGGTAQELHERLRNVGSWAARFALLDELLLARADPDRQVSRDIAEAWRLLVGTGGAIRAGELAERVGWSPRYLQRRLLAETGLTPKAAARVARFDRARRMLQRKAGAGHSPALADIAAACGYYDQAHLAREFRELAGCPPTTWLAEEFRNVQASPDLLGEGSQA